MIWIREFMLILFLTTIAGSLLMFFWMAAVYAGIGKRNAHYVWWMLRGVLAGYLIPLVYLLFYRCLEVIRNCYDVLSVSNVKIDNVFLVLFLIWIMGSVLFLLSQLNTWICFQRIKRSSMTVPTEYLSILKKLCMEMHLEKTVSLYQGYGVESPFIIGIRNPRIYLPVKEFSTEQLEMILYHELTHYKNGDTFWKPLFGILGNIYWFSPLSRYLWTEAIRWIEANCDFYCCKGRFPAKKYFLLLLEMGSADQSRLNGYAPMWTESGRELEWRVKCIKGNQMKRTNNNVILTIIIMSVLGGGIAAHVSAKGIKRVYYEAYMSTVEEIEEPLNNENELPEYEGTVEDFAGMEIVEDTEEQINERSAVGTIDRTVNNNTVQYTGGFKVSAGEKIIVSASITPSNKTVKIGIVKQDGKTSYVNGKDFVLHNFSISKTGTYKVFVSNDSGKKVTVSGYYIEQ